MPPASLPVSSGVLPALGLASAPMALNKQGRGRPRRFPLLPHPLYQPMSHSLDAPTAAAAAGVGLPPGRRQAGLRRGKGQRQPEVQGLGPGREHVGLRRGRGYAGRQRGLSILHAGPLSILHAGQARSGVQRDRRLAVHLYPLTPPLASSFQTAGRSGAEQKGVSTHSAADSKSEKDIGAKVVEAAALGAAVHGGAGEGGNGHDASQQEVPVAPATAGGGAGPGRPSSSGGAVGAAAGSALWRLSRRAMLRRPPVEPAGSVQCSNMQYFTDRRAPFNAPPLSHRAMLHRPPRILPRRGAADAGGGGGVAALSASLYTKVSDQNVAFLSLCWDCKRGAYPIPISLAVPSLWSRLSTSPVSLSRLPGRTATVVPPSLPSLCFPTLCRLIPVSSCNRSARLIPISLLPCIISLPSHLSAVPNH